jgi:hypothetical protein
MEQPANSSLENKRYNDDVMLLDGLYEFHPDFFKKLSDQELNALRMYYLTGLDVPKNIFEYRSELLTHNPAIEKEAHAVLAKIRRIAGIQ